MDTGYVDTLIFLLKMAIYFLPVKRQRHNVVMHCVCVCMRKGEERSGGLR